MEGLERALGRRGLVNSGIGVRNLYNRFVSEAESSDRRDLWLPVGVALAAALIALAAWGLLVAERRDHLLGSSRATASELRDTLEAALAEHADTVARLAALREGLGSEPESGRLAALQREVGSLLDDLLRGRARGYALSLRWDGIEVYARGTPSSDRWQRWWRVEETLALPGGLRWQLVQWPTAELASARLTPIPHYLLAAGLLLSLVLALLVYQLRVIARQSRFLAASNRALERRGAELETAVGERTEALQDAISELQAFNDSVSHDLRSPLGAILNFTSILEEDFRGRLLDEEGLALLARIRRSATRATALLEDLLRLSRTRRAALRFERIDMNDLVEETFAQLRAAQDDGEVDWVVAPLPDAVGDRTLLGDVLANLLGNALKYSRGCEKRCIRVSGRRDEDECVYEVRDNGQGFDMRFAGKLFGLFERLHSDGEIEGTGIGLAMVKRIVRRHGGRVFAEGEPGRGACFGFALPLRELP